MGPLWFSGRGLGLVGAARPSRRPVPASALHTPRVGSWEARGFRAGLPPSVGAVAGLSQDTQAPGESSLLGGDLGQTAGACFQRGTRPRGEHSLGRQDCRRARRAGPAWLPAPEPLLAAADHVASLPSVAPVPGIHGLRHLTLKCRRETLCWAGPPRLRVWLGGGPSDPLAAGPRRLLPLVGRSASSSLRENEGLTSQDTDRMPFLTHGSLWLGFSLHGAAGEGGGPVRVTAPRSGGQPGPLEALLGPAGRGRAPRSWGFRAAGRGPWGGLPSTPRWPWPPPPRSGPSGLRSGRLAVPLSAGGCTPAPLPITLLQALLRPSPGVP